MPSERVALSRIYAKKNSYVHGDEHPFLLSVENTAYNSPKANLG